MSNLPKTPSPTSGQVTVCPWLDGGELSITSPPPLTRDAVIERLCHLSAEVLEHVYFYQVAADCICRPSTNGGLTFRYDEQPLAFIETAVRDAIDRVEVSHATQDRLKRMRSTGFANFFGPQS